MTSVNFPDSIDFWVAQVSRLHYTRLHALMADLCLFPGQPPVLFRLWEKDGRSQTELADLLRIKPATMTKMITRMEKTGLYPPRAGSQRPARVVDFSDGGGPGGKKRCAEYFRASEQRAGGRLYA